jgi:hypothetical protein
MPEIIEKWGRHYYVVLEPVLSDAKRLRLLINKSGKRAGPIQKIALLKSLEELRVFATIERKIHCLFIDVCRCDTDAAIEFLAWFREVRPYSPIVLYVSKEELNQVKLTRVWAMRLQHYWKILNDISSDKLTRMLRAILPRAEDYYWSQRFHYNPLYHYQRFQSNVADEFMSRGFRTYIEATHCNFRIDVLAIRDEPQGLRVAIECKDVIARNVGPNDISRFLVAFPYLKRSGVADVGLIIAPEGFTEEAKRLALECGVDVCRWRELPDWIASRPETKTL